MALYVRRARDAGRELAALPEAGLIGDRGTMLFAEDVATLASPYSGQPANLYDPPLDEIQDRIVVSRAVRLFAGPWTAAFLRHLNLSLRPGGSLVVPFRHERNVGDGFMTLEGLRDTFGQKGTIVSLEATRSDPSGYVAFAKAEHIPKSPSLLEWFFESQPSLAMDLITLAGLSAAQQVAAVERTCTDFVRTIANDVPNDSRAPSDLESAFGIIRYWIIGLSYKAPLLGWIVRRYLRGRRDLQFADLGGGPGWVAAEMLLDESLGIARAVNVDILPGYALLARRMLDGVGGGFKERFSFDVDSMEQLQGDGQFDLVTMLGGTMIYSVPRERQPAMVRRAWDSLRSGGILVVLENIKHPRYERDYDLMLTAADLDGMLSAVGSVEYASATAAVPLSPEQVGDRTVFRIVRKA